MTSAEIEDLAYHTLLAAGIRARDICLLFTKTATYEPIARWTMDTGQIHQ